MTNWSRQHLANYIAEMTEGDTNYDELVEEIAAYLLDENKTDQLDSLIRDISNYRADKGHLEASVDCAHDIDEQIFDDVKYIIKSEFPNSKNQKVSYQLKPEMVGGVRINLPGEQLDMSVRTKLNEFKRLISERNG